MTGLPGRRTLLRFAQRIYDHWVAAAPSATWQLPENGWYDLRRAVEHWQCAQQRNWRSAAEHARSIVQLQIDCLIDHLATYRATQVPTNPHRLRVTLRDLYDDLLALHNEFPEVRFDAAQHQLAVQTAPIRLDGYDLGSFEIVLNLPQLGAQQPYRVVAVEPQPASGDSTTTHPHVRDEVLCEGNGHSSIRAALRHGRLLDFFMLVRQVLETYNSSNAFIKLDHWHGRTCPDCGGDVDDDNTTTCERCDTEICYDCSYGCHRCGRGCCRDCRSRCDDCDRDVCHGCLEACAICEEDFCSECLADGRCKNCPEPSKEECEYATNEMVPTTSDARTETDLEIQPAGLGKTALSTGPG